MTMKRKKTKTLLRTLTHTHCIIEKYITKPKEKYGFAENFLRTNLKD